MPVEIYQRVMLLTNRFASTDNVAIRAIGYIIEIYPNGDCEIEFSDENGITYAQIVAKPDELESAEIGQ